MEPCAFECVYTVFQTATTESVAIALVREISGNHVKNIFSDYLCKFRGIPT